MIYFIGWTADYDRQMIGLLKPSIRHKVINFPEGKLIYQLNKRLYYWLNGFYLFLHSLTTHRHSTYFFKDSDGYGYLRFAQFFKGKRVLVIRNIVSEKDVIKYKKIFSHIYSFDKVQCDKYSFKYMLQVFADIKPQLGNPESKNACYFVGLDKNRLGVINTISEILNGYDIKSVFNVVKDKTSSYESCFYINNPLTYDDNIKMVQENKFLLEINQEGQEGITLRALESIFYQKKLITNNLSLREYDFYDPCRIFIFKSCSTWDFEAFEQFLVSKYSPVSESILNNYKFSTFITNVMNTYE
nr:hypothetical protein [uncultured Enterobacter sp.]